MKEKLRIQCPKCAFSVETEIKDEPKFFRLFICPNCRINVVYYDNKIDIISDRLLNKLIKAKKVKPRGRFNIPKKGALNKEAIANLRATLQSTKSVEEFLRKM